ncbi:MAG: Rrf2 family transcriptional regulator [Kiritimatiellae bacterium]|nr:Rrf2 family transcriptional regulator [Kiritimatiellia bacterium]MDD5522417.1 Rrf2 family transcriptional regulator [Kiritimatiellia bacterium]
MIKLSTKVRYATRIAVYLAMRDEKHPARKQEIAEAEDISADYVEQILIKLKTLGLVRSHRGTKGGFVLARDPHKITVADVINSVDGQIAIAPCINDKCNRIPFCPTRPVWEKANEALVNIFSKATIGELADEGRKLRSPKSWTFEI